MTEWNPQIVLIEKVVKHPNADSLDIVTVLGDYPIITKHNSYAAGDRSIYFPIETIVPDTNEFHFLSPVNREQYEEDGEIKSRITGPKFDIGSVPEKYRRLKSKKIRGIYSQGILINLKDYPDLCNFNIGDSVVNFFGLKKFEEEEEDNIQNAKRPSGANQASPPKGWSIPYYDIDGLRKYINCLSPDEDIILTEKIHGSNFSACHDGEKLWVKSRNFYKKMDSDDPWWDIAIRYSLEEKLKLHPMKIFFGELYGQVKNFRYDCEIVNGKLNSKIRFFDILDSKSMRYHDYDDFKDLLSELNLESAPELYRGKWLGKEDMYPFAEGLTTLGSKHVREGFVLRTVKERFEPHLNSRMIVKLVGEGYNLSK